MSPKETWVLYNKFTEEIVDVSAEHFLASRKWEELANEKPLDGLVHNRNKLMVCTLSRALAEIKTEHQAKIEYLKEEYNTALKYEQ